MTDKDLDSEISRAVREIMSVDTDPAFRARVFARLERSAPRVFTWTRAAIVGSVAGAVILAVLLMRPAHLVRSDPAAVATNAETPTPAPSQAVRLPAADRAGSTPVASRNIRSTPALQARRQTSGDVPPGIVVATVAADEPTVIIDPLDRIDPISVAPLEPDPIAPSEIVIEPLAPIAELEIAPLSPQIERD